MIHRGAERVITGMDGGGIMTLFEVWPGFDRGR
jgi:hypothetical protein